MTKKVICSVAELEPFQADDPDTAPCKDCGLNVLRVAYDLEALGSYGAPIYSGGGGLEGWSFDGGKVVAAPDPWPGPYIKIAYPNHFDHLCIRYNREGEARINVVAVDIDTSQRIRPEVVPAAGDDAASPIAKAFIGKTPFPVNNFVWDDGQFTIRPPDSAPLGAFTTSPPVLTGDMRLTAKDTLPGGLGHTYKFVSWERNRLSRWEEGTEHQWTGDGPIMTFDEDSYFGLIAYYRRHDRDIKVREPITIPQPIEYGYPLPFGRLFAAIRSLVARLFRRR